MSESLTLNGMLNYLERWKLHGKPPPSEYRLHPDDFDELKRKAMSEVPTFAASGCDRFCGIRIVVDSTAPRLPRRAP